MALTRLDLTGDGTTTVHDVNFQSGYLREEFVYVYLKGNDYTNQLNYSWLNDTQIQVDTPVSNDVEFHIRRVVPRDKPVNDYEQGAILREDNLDDSFLQSVMTQEEITDGYLTPAGDVLLNSELDMTKHRIKNLADSVDPDDAVKQAVVTELDADIKAVDTRLVALEQAIPVADAQYVANFSYTATGGETTLETNYAFSYAVLAINGAMQTIGKAFNKLGSQFVLAEPLEEGDEVAAVLTLPFVPSDEFVGTGDWLYTALGGETQVDVGLSFTKILLSINGVTQVPTKAFSATGTTLFFAEALEEGDELYGMISA